MYSIGITATLLGVCIKTLRRWDKKNLITCFRTLGGHRRFPHQEIERILRNHKKEHSQSSIRKMNTCVIYSRVSSHKQQKRGDLERQISLMREYACNHQPAC
ncbi:MAG: recombinase family protein [Candidatus Lokiarchaeota archaeon]|nr:recombinase family protein [Candidatus Lokiarchaeota archaeon]